MKYTKYIWGLLSLSIVANLLQYTNRGVTEKKYNALLSQMLIEDKTSRLIIGKDLSNISMQPFNLTNLHCNLNKTIIVYSNLAGCGKCIDHHLQVAAKTIDTTSIIYVFYAHNKSQIKQNADKYKLHGKIYWDKDNELAKHIDINTERINPFAMLIYNGKIMQIRYSYENDYAYIEKLSLLYNML